MKGRKGKEKAHFEELRRLDLLFDAVEAGGDRGREGEVGVHVGAGNAALDPQPYEKES